MTKLEAARKLDEELKALARRARETEAQMAARLLDMKERGLHRALGFSRIQEYARRELHLGAEKTKALIEIASRAAKLPGVARAFREGELPWTHCRELVRVATPEDEVAWVERARKLTSRELEHHVALAKGERPKVRIVLELDAADAADLDAAVKHLREERGEAVPLGAAVAELARRALGPAVERPGHQVVVHECPSCRRASRDTGAGELPVSERELAAAKVDAEVLDLRAKPPQARKTITPAERREVIARDHGRCRLCGTTAWLHIHHTEPKSGETELLGLLCDGCHKRVVHEGHVVMTGRAPDFDLRLRDGTKLRTTARGGT